jgi:hypothetical protein
MEGIDVRTMAKHLAGVIREHKEKLALEHLTAVPGIKLAKAAQILSAFELARRYLLRETVKIVCAADVLPLVADSVGQPRRNPLHFWRTRTRSRQDRALSPPRLVRRNRGNHVVLSLTAMSRA